MNRGQAEKIIRQAAALKELARLDAIEFGQNFRARFPIHRKDDVYVEIQCVDYGSRDIGESFTQMARDILVPAFVNGLNQYRKRLEQIANGEEE